MEWVSIINDEFNMGKAYQLWSPEHPTVRSNGSVPRRCTGVVHRSGEWPQWRARVSGSEHTREFDNKEDAMQWIETQVKLMGFT